MLKSFHRRPWEKSRKWDDVCMRREEVQDGDIVIPIMGRTGSGKSTFINNVLGEAVAPVNDGLESCTRLLQHYAIEIREDSPLKERFPGRRLVLVDTPGFDDTDLSDVEILRRIAVWLASSYSEHRMKVGGVIYTYPIYPGRISRSDRSNLKVFQKICGQKNITKVVLATTFWGMDKLEVKKRREGELRTKFWQEMLGDPESDSKNLALLCRLENSPDSAWQLIDKVLGRLLNADVDGGILQLQMQLVDRRQGLRDTDAAQELRRKLKELLDESESTDWDARRERFNDLLAEFREMKLPLTRRIMRFIKSADPPIDLGIGNVNALQSS